MNSGLTYREFAPADGPVRHALRRDGESVCTYPGGRIPAVRFCKWVYPTIGRSISRFTRGWRPVIMVIGENFYFVVNESKFETIVDAASGSATIETLGANPEQHTLSDSTLVAIEVGGFLDTRYGFLKLLDGEELTEDRKKRIGRIAYDRRFGRVTH